MSQYKDLTSEEQIATLLPLAREVCLRYGFGECIIESINHEFNSTFKVTTPQGVTYALRVNINSKRSLENLKAEIFWTRNLSEVHNLNVAHPVAATDGSYFATIWHEMLQRDLWAVIYEWIDGVEIGDELELSSLYQTGATMAKMHLASAETSLPIDASLHTISDFFWGGMNNISTSSEIDETARSILDREIARIQEITHSLYATNTPQIIHGDIHGWNVMWNGKVVTIFDFDDCVIGLRVQDIAVTLYYLDTPEQDRAVLDGYSSVTSLPPYSDEQLSALILQRRIYLLNYLLESETPEHRNMVPQYLEKTLERIKKAP